jgi:PAS domain S-box-containing protein
LLNRFAGGRSALTRGKSLALFVLFAAGVTTVSATVGVTSLSLAGFGGWPDYGRIWLTWWLGDAVGAVVVAPVILLWAAHPRLAWTRTQLIELAFVLLSLIGVGWAVFVASDYPIGFLTLPVCIWTAFRFGQREAATATCVLSVLATWATVHGHGSFATTQSPNAALLELQLFMAVTTIVGVAVGGAVAGRQQAEGELRRAHASLELAVEARTRDLQSTLEKLRISDVRFTEAQQLAKIGGWDWNVRDNTVTWSEELFRIFGFEPHSFVPYFEKLFDDIHPQDRSKVSARIRDAIENRQPFEFEHRIIRPDGQVRTLRANGRVVVDDQDQVVRMWGTAQDITALKEAEETVRQSERRLQTIIDAEPACVKLVSFEGLLLASMLYSLPFVVQPLQAAFEALGREPLEVAATLRAGPVDRMLRVALPLARRGFLSALVLGFAHTLGEFGVVLMVGGSIPGVTRVLSIALFDRVEAIDYASAHRIAGTLLATCFVVLFAVYATRRHQADLRP